MADLNEKKQREAEQRAKSFAKYRMNCAKSLFVVIDITKLDDLYLFLVKASKRRHLVTRGLYRTRVRNWLISLGWAATDQNEHHVSSLFSSSQFLVGVLTPFCRPFEAFFVVFCGFLERKI